MRKVRKRKDWKQQALAGMAQPACLPRKKVAIVQFDVANAQHVDDINNIYDGLPLALSSRLEASGEFLTIYNGRSIPAGAGEPQRKARQSLKLPKRQARNSLFPALG